MLNMKFSVALIAKNEEKTLPRLLKSLAGIEDIVLVDTGSTDKTIEVAKSFGVKVYEEKFDEIIDEKMAKKINKFSQKNNEPDLVKVGEKCFNFAKARNWIAEKAKNDVIFMPDCDEVVEWDLNSVESLLTEADRLEYNFIYSFDSEGRPVVQFKHSKFYNRKKLKWVRNIHEVLAGAGKTVFTDKILLKHYQNHDTNRNQYLTGLAIDYIQNEYNDRNCHYFARELMYKGFYKTAIDFFELHVSKPGWKTEQGQSFTYRGDCYKYLGNVEKAMENYAIGWTYDMGRREPLMNMGQILLDTKKFAEAERLFKMILTIPKGNYYSNIEANYTHLPYHQLALAQYYMGKKEEGLQNIKKALELDPNNGLYKENLKFYL